MAMMSAGVSAWDWAAEIDLLAYLISRDIFGMRSFGTIYGYMFAFFNLWLRGSGHSLMGLSQSRTGSCGAAIITFAAG